MSDTHDQRDQEQPKEEEKENKPASPNFAHPAAAFLAPGERSIRLRISSGDDGKAPVELYAQACVLRSFSRVMAGMLDSCEGAAAGGSSGGGEGSSGGGGDRTGAHLTVPLDGDDPNAWDDALSVMYFTLRGEPFKMEWEHAERLLVLADKYDLPGVTAAVANFLRSPEEEPEITPRLDGHLDENNVWRWLQLASTAGLDDLVDLCIEHSLRHKALQPPTVDQLRALAPDDASHLLSVMWEKALRAARL